MLQKLMFAVQCLALVHSSGTTTSCFDDASYITCEDVEDRSSKCECPPYSRECHIELTITRQPSENEDFEYMVNGEHGLGPTIIANYNSLVVIDVRNYMNEDTSIHWHGMHQNSFPFMDGVGEITQYAIKPNGTFRYIFRAYPQGTHWYHSHTRTQREFGLLGVLIVREKPKKGLRHSIVDVPESQTLVLQEYDVPESSGEESRFCLPDGKPVPVPFKRLSLRMNGRKSAPEPGFAAGTSAQGIEFMVEPGKHYRFRVLAAMNSNLYSINIQDHEMHVIATDGFLVRRFTTDYLIMHVSERYDFVIKAKQNVQPGETFAIRVQTLAANCEDRHKWAGVGYAHLVYTEATGAGSWLKFPGRRYLHPFTYKPRAVYTVLNCPMSNLPPGYYRIGTTTECHDVTSLELAYQTEVDDIPSRNPTEAFFDFERITVNGFQALINGVHFQMPSKPLVDNTRSETEGCRYPVSCSNPGEEQCTHAFYFGENEEQQLQSMRFVLSALATDETSSTYSTHPIHMHGHSYFVVKVGYPDYHANGTIKNINQDVEVGVCGPGHWRNGAPSDLPTIDRTTVRKDVIIVPAGGYVVVDFIADNPGYWFMHCHIDGHLDNGMAIALGENIACARTPPSVYLDADAQDVCMSIEKYKKWESIHICSPQSVKVKKDEIEYWENLDIEY